MLFRRTSRENPITTLHRYSKAIDDHLDEATATARQRDDLMKLIQAVAAVREAQDLQQRKLTINAKIGYAIGLCEAYIGRYNVPVSSPSSR